MTKITIIKKRETEMESLITSINQLLLEKWKLRGDMTMYRDIAGIVYFYQVLIYDQD